MVRYTSGVRYCLAMSVIHLLVDSHVTVVTASLRHNSGRYMF